MNRFLWSAETLRIISAAPVKSQEHVLATVSNALLREAVKGRHSLGISQDQFNIEILEYIAQELEKEGFQIRKYQKPPHYSSLMYKQGYEISWHSK